jgi:hypothetical protein
MTFIFKIADNGSIGIPDGQEFASGFVGLILNEAPFTGPKIYDGNNDRGIHWDISALDSLGIRKRIMLPIDGTEVLLTAAQTLTNKTIAAPKASGLSSYANNAAAVAGGLSVGSFYVVSGTDPAVLAVVV